MSLLVRAPIFISMLVGLLGLYRFSQHVRPVDAVGLFVCGAAFGIGCLRLWMHLSARRRTQDLP